MAELPTKCRGEKKCLLSVRPIKRDRIRVPSPESCPLSAVFVPLLLPCFFPSLSHMSSTSSNSISPLPLPPRQLASSNVLSLDLSHILTSFPLLKACSNP